MREIELGAPREVALRVATRMFDNPFGRDLGGRAGAKPGHPSGARAPDGAVESGLADYQRDAVTRANVIMRRWGGVLIADSVGLGKTHVGAALVEAAAADARRVIVVTPAALRRQWSRLLPGGVPCVSHTRLSLGRAPDPCEDRPDLVVVDEAHAFRNPRTQRYSELAGLCVAAHVVLLTATPINNGLYDVYHLIRLFASDGAFSALGVSDLRAVFLDGEDSAAGARRVMRAIMIRRGRTSLAIRAASLPHGLVFPRRAMPRPVRYDLDAAYGARLDEVLAAISRLPFTAFRRDNGPPASGAALLRMTLLKRLESSTTAFSATLRSLIRYHQALLDALRAGRRLPAREHRTLSGADGEQLLIAPLVLAPQRGSDTDGLRARVASDLTELRRMLALMPDGRALDPKLIGLRALLGRINAKAIVFSEYRETAEQIWRALRQDTQCALIHGGAAFLGAGRAGRRTVVERFAPRANGVAEPAEHERVQVLIATDVLAEGLNLQDAAHVVSYDLPWNPVRLIQRAGRIDRLGSPHETIYLHCFLPDAGLERVLRLVDRLRTKLRAIRSGVGDTSDASVIPNSSLVRRIASGDSSLLDDLEAMESAPWDAELRLRHAFDAHRTGVSDSPAAPASASTRAVEAPRRLRDSHVGPLPVAVLPHSAVAIPSQKAAASPQATRSDLDRRSATDSGTVVVAFLGCDGLVRLVLVRKDDVDVDAPAAYDVLTAALAAERKRDPSVRISSPKRRLGESRDLTGVAKPYAPARSMPNRPAGVQALVEDAVERALLAFAEAGRTVLSGVTRRRSPGRRKVTSAHQLRRLILGRVVGSANTIGNLSIELASRAQLVVDALEGGARIGVDRQLRSTVALANDPRVPLLRVIVEAERVLDRLGPDTPATPVALEPLAAIIVEPAEYESCP